MNILKRINNKYTHKTYYGPGTGSYGVNGIRWMPRQPLSMRSVQARFADQAVTQEKK